MRLAFLDRHEKQLERQLFNVGAAIDAHRKLVILITVDILVFEDCTRDSVNDETGCSLNGLKAQVRSRLTGLQ
jgi:hypothetical protein